jgi:hypothetical protein
MRSGLYSSPPSHVNSKKSCCQYQSLSDWKTARQSAVGAQLSCFPALTTGIRKAYRKLLKASAFVMVKGLPPKDPDLDENKEK